MISTKKLFFTTLGLVYIDLLMSSTGESKKILSPGGNMFKKYVYNNASKYWNHYVRKLLYNSLEIHLPKYNNPVVFIRKYISPFSGEVVNITQYKYHRCDKSHLTCLVYLVQSAKKLVISSRHIKELYVGNSKTLIEPLKMRSFAWTSVPYGVIVGIRYQGLAYSYFNLHSYFHLNVTFHYIYFSSNTFFKCSFGKITVSSGDFIKGPKNINKFKYCGIVSSFTLYLSSNKVQIYMSSKWYVTFRSILSHSVIDAYKLSSYSVKSKNPVAPVSMMIFFMSKLFLLKYQLQVEHFERINILCNISTYDMIEVYDGPGTLYNMLEPSVFESDLVIYTTTTFQNVIFLSTRNNTLFNTVFMKYNTTMILKTHREFFVDVNEHVQMTSQTELNNTEIKLVIFKTQAHSFLNITIHQIKFKGENQYSCGFAGITSYDITGNGTYKKISAICYNNEKNRNVYTQSSIMLLVMYSYKKYSNFSLNLSVSTTQCKATIINICELPHDPLSLESTSYFSVRKHNCIILQLDHGQLNMSIYRSNRYKNRKVGTNHESTYTGIYHIGRK